MITYWKLYTRVRHYYDKENINFCKHHDSTYILIKNTEIIDKFDDIYERAKSLNLIKEWEVYLAPNGNTYVYGTLDGEVKGI